jgi:hypothetical protein
VAATGGGSGKPVVYSSSGHCTNRGATFTMTSSSGTCTVKYDQAGNRHYTAAPQVAETVDATKAGQSITITTHTPASAPYGSQFTVAAVDAGSGKPIVYVGRGACTNKGATFTMTSASGTCTVDYDQAGTRNYKAARKTETVNATKAGQVIRVTTHAPSTAILDSQFTVAATGGRSGNPIVYSSTGACTPSGGSFMITSASGVCTVKFSQAGNTDYNPASGLIETANAIAAIGGFSVPAANSTVPYAPGPYTVRLALTDAFGKPLTAAEATPLAAAGDIAVALTGPNGSTAQLASAPCTKNKSQFFFCTLSLPSGLATGPSNPYTLTASQTAGSGSVVLPTNAKAQATDANPESFFFQ